MEFSSIQYELEEQLAFIRFLGTTSHNIFTLEMQDELYRAWDDVLTHSDIRGVIFSGTDSAFATGSDLRTFNMADARYMMDSSRKMQELFNSIQNFPGPTIAAINGYAISLGLELALACDFRFADGNSVFAFPEVQMGLIPNIGGTQRLSRLVGIEQAKMMIFSGCRIDAEEARQIGLISRIYPSESLLEESRSFMKQMIQNAPIALANSKQCINLALEMTMEQGLILERNTWLSLCMTEDVVEGIDAFLNKRKPNFTGR